MDFRIKKTRNLSFYCYSVEERDRGTLETLILKHIKIGSRVYSDCYSVYVNNRATPKKSHLIKYGYTHYFVNHRVEFVSAVLSTIHTNTIESLWKEVKNYLRKSRKTSKFLFSIYRYYFTKEVEKKIQIEITVSSLLKEQIPYI